MKNDNSEYLVLNAAAADSNGECAELTDLELNLILGGYEPGYQESNPNANGWDLTGGSSNSSQSYGPPPPPVDNGGGSQGGGGGGGGGLPPGAPGILQPGGGDALAEHLSDASGYYGGHAAAELADLAAAAAPFPYNYTLDKFSDAVRPTESSYEEYAKNH
jgi:hypothetical protein